ncbi:MAG: hypothetical protein ACKO26_05750 [Planctomycetota bacterium]
MTVKELIRLLREFPETLPVYFSLGDGSDRVIQPVDAIMNLVNTDLRMELPDEYPERHIPEGYFDSVVVYPHVIRDNGN